MPQSSRVHVARELQISCQRFNDKAAAKVGYMASTWKPRRRRIANAGSEIYRKTSDQEQEERQSIQKNAKA